MLNKLRTETEELHRQIEQDNLASLIMSHEIKEEEYKLLLLQNYVSYHVTENAIARHINGKENFKSTLLEKDLQELKVNLSIVHEYEQDFKIGSRAEAVGAKYVVEGSALGGMMISKEIPNCPHLAHLSRHYFFNGDRQSINGWRTFLKDLKTESFTPEEEEQAVLKAKETFRFFGRVFNEVQLQS